MAARGQGAAVGRHQAPGGGGFVDLDAQRAAAAVGALHAGLACFQLRGVQLQAGQAAPQVHLDRGAATEAFLRRVEVEIQLVLARPHVLGQAAGRAVEVETFGRGGGGGNCSGSCNGRCAGRGRMGMGMGDGEAAAVAAAMAATRVARMVAWRRVIAVLSQNSSGG